MPMKIRQVLYSSLDQASIADSLVQGYWSFWGTVNPKADGLQLKRSCLGESCRVQASGFTVKVDRISGISGPSDDPGKIHILST